MRYRSLAMALMVVGSLCAAGLGPTKAQPDLQEDRPSPPLSLDESIALVALWASRPYLVSLHCGIGDPGKWRQIFSAMDRRIDHCAKGHLEWQAIRQEALSHARRDGALGPSDDEVAQARFREAAAKADLEMDKDVRSAMCTRHRSSALWRDLLAPGSVPEEEAAAAWKEEAKREGANPHYCDRGLCPRFYRNILRWGEQQSWVTASCATLFPGK